MSGDASSLGEQGSHKPTAETLAALDMLTGSRRRKKTSSKLSQKPPLAANTEPEVVDPQLRLQVVQVGAPI